jgi:branched-chain amino acid transport system ATP-binding protein
VSLALAQRAYFMERGTVRFEGPTADLLDRRDLVRAVFFGDDEEGAG